MADRPPAPSVASSNDLASSECNNDISGGERHNLSEVDMFKFLTTLIDPTPPYARMSTFTTVGVMISLFAAMVANKKIHSWRESRLSNRQMEMVDHVHRAVMMCSALHGKLDGDPAARAAHAYSVKDDVSRYMMPQLQDLDTSRDVDRKFKEATLKAMQDWVAYYEAKDPNAKPPKALLRDYFDRIGVKREVESVPPAPPRKQHQKGGDLSG
jgi:hypothetical protein